LGGRPKSYDLSMWRGGGGGEVRRPRLKLFHRFPDHCILIGYKFL